MITSTENIILRRFTVGPYPINGYLLADAKSRIAAFIDPGGFDDAIDHFLKDHNLELRHLLFTHGHYDHTDGLPEFTKRYSLQCYAGKGEVHAASHILQHDDTVDIGSLTVRVLSTPGHTSSGLSFYCGNMVFTGDALFCGSVGGTTSTRNAQQQLTAVRETIFTLPDTTTVYPAHGPITTVAAEKYGNPFFH